VVYVARNRRYRRYILTRRNMNVICENIILGELQEDLGKTNREAEQSRVPIAV
jgi:hypothetical protein